MTLGWLSNSIKKGCLEKESNCAYSFANAEQDTKQILKNLQQPSPLSKKVVKGIFIFILLILFILIFIFHTKKFGYRAYRF